MKLKSMIGPISAIFPNCILQVDFQTKNRIADFNTKARNVNKTNREKSISLSYAIHNSIRKWQINAAIIVLGVVISF